jgi:hypothetical protein
VVLTGERSDQGVNTRVVVTDLEQARTKVLDQHISYARSEADEKRLLWSIFQVGE